MSEFEYNQRLPGSCGDAAALGKSKQGGTVSRARKGNSVSFVLPPGGLKDDDHPTEGSTASLPDRWNTEICHTLIASSVSGVQANEAGGTTGGCGLKRRLFGHWRKSKRHQIVGKKELTRGHSETVEFINEFIRSHPSLTKRCSAVTMTQEQIDERRKNYYGPSPDDFLDPTHPMAYGPVFAALEKTRLYRRDIPCDLQKREEIIFEDSEPEDTRSSLLKRAMRHKGLQSLFGSCWSVDAIEENFKEDSKSTAQFASTDTDAAETSPSVLFSEKEEDCSSDYHHTENKEEPLSPVDHATVETTLIKTLQQSSMMGETLNQIKNDDKPLDSMIPLESEEGETLGNVETIDHMCNDDSDRMIPLSLEDLPLFSVCPLISPDPQKANKAKVEKVDPTNTESTSSFFKKIDSIADFRIPVAHIAIHSDDFSQDATKFLKSRRFLSGLTRCRKKTSVTRESEFQNPLPTGVCGLGARAASIAEQDKVDAPSRQVEFSRRLPRAAQAFGFPQEVFLNEKQFYNLQYNSASPHELVCQELGSELTAKNLKLVEGLTAHTKLRLRPNKEAEGAHHDRAQSLRLEIEGRLAWDRKKTPFMTNLIEQKLMNEIKTTASLMVEYMDQVSRERTRAQISVI